jgi:hypothetical protein
LSFATAVFLYLIVEEGGDATIVGGRSTGQDPLGGHHHFLQLVLLLTSLLRREMMPP